MKLNAALLAVAVAFALAACNKPADTATPDTGATPPADTTTAPAEGTPPAEDAAPTEAAPVDGAAASTGVAECDDYVAKVKACIADKIPENMREETLKGMDQVTAAWSAPGVDKAQLAEACKTAMDQAKSAYGAMGCTF
jgi:hypothetical protein